MNDHDEVSCSFLGERSLIKTRNYGQNFVSFAIMNQVNRAVP